MDRRNYSIASNRRSDSSLLILNNDCLMKIFEYLDLSDFISLAKTCNRLLFVADTVYVRNFKEIKVKGGSNPVEGVISSAAEFYDILSVVGIHLRSIEVHYGNEFVLEAIGDNCNNLETLMLCGGPPPLQELGKLKELKLEGVKMSTNQLKTFFEKNPNIESIKYNNVDEDMNENFVKSLQLLPKLKSLDTNIILYENILQQLLRLDSLTKLDIYLSQNCNHALTELAKKLNLTELRFSADVDNTTFDIIKSFRNLEVLSIYAMSVRWPKSYFLPETTVFPPKLKIIKLHHIHMDCCTLLAIIKQLKSLEIFYL